MNSLRFHSSEAGQSMKPSSLNRRRMLQASTAAIASATVMQPSQPAAGAPGAAAESRAAAGQSPARAPRFGDARDWWFQRRFGMFVHWGLYAIHGWHEQEQWRRRVPRSEYAKLQA